ncbi:MAG: S8 family serine peptidase, partial [Firmicutes bacterium]|nr:S8 family serine peptidase [Bacillota bacterium]
ISVGGVAYDDESGVPLVAEFSSRGPYKKHTRPDMVAPAVRIVTTSHQGGYRMMTGTSMAAPIVAGVCACVLSKRPKYTPDKIKELLCTTAKPIDTDANASGCGLIDCQKLCLYIE